MLGVMRDREVRKSRQAECLPHQMKTAALDGMLLILLAAVLIWPLFQVEYFDNWMSIDIQLSKYSTWNSGQIRTAASSIRSMPSSAAVFIWWGRHSACRDFRTSRSRMTPNIFSFSLQYLGPNHPPFPFRPPPTLESRNHMSTESQTNSNRNARPSKLRHISAG